VLLNGDAAMQMRPTLRGLDHKPKANVTAKPALQMPRHSTANMNREAAGISVGFGNRLR
jgi:hypothetical protein